MQTLIILVSVLTAVVLFLLWFFLLRRVFPGASFRWYALRRQGQYFGLDHQEIAFLARLFATVKPPNPDAFFSSRRIRQQIIDSYTEAVRKNSESAKKQEECIALAMRIRRKVEIRADRLHKYVENTYNLQPGTALRLVVPDYGYFQSKVISVEPGFILASFPEGENAHQIHWKGRELAVYFWQAGDAGYSFATKIMDVVRERELSALFIEHSSKLERSQMRHFLRMEADLPVELVPLVVSATALNEQGRVQSDGIAVQKEHPFQGTLTNLSANGAAVELPGILPGADFVHLVFSLPEDGGRKVNATGRLIGVRDSRTSRKTFRYSIQFVEIDTAARNAIEQYVYKHQSKPAYNI